MLGVQLEVLVAGATDDAVKVAIDPGLAPTEGDAGGAVAMVAVPLAPWTTVVINVVRGITTVVIDPAVFAGIEYTEGTAPVPTGPVANMVCGATPEALAGAVAMGDAPLRLLNRAGTAAELMLAMGAASTALLVPSAVVVPLGATIEISEHVVYVSFLPDGKPVVPAAVGHHQTQYSVYSFPTGRSCGSAKSFWHQRFVPSGLLGVAILNCACLATEIGLRFTW